MTDIQLIKAQIKQAQEWALNHFNADNATNTQIVNPNTLEFLPPACFVEFPDVDKMTVTPSFFGQRAFISFHYRLAFYKNGNTAWIGHHPIYGYELPPLNVLPNSHPDSSTTGPQDK